MTSRAFQNNENRQIENEIEANQCMSYFSKVDSVYMYKVPGEYDFEYKPSSPLTITISKYRIIFSKDFVPKFGTHLYCFLLIIKQNGLLDKSLLNNISVMSLDFQSNATHMMVKNIVSEFIKSVMKGKKPDFEIMWLKQTKESNNSKHNVNMNEFMNAARKSSHNFKDLAELIEKKTLGTPHIPQKYIDFLKKHKWYSNRNEIIEDGDALFDYIPDPVPEPEYLEEKPLKNTFPMKLHKIISQGSRPLRYRMDNPPVQIPHVIKGNMISCRLDKNDLIELGVGKVLNLDLMNEHNSFLAELTYLDLSKIDEIDLMYNDKYPRETLHFGVIGMNDLIKPHQDAHEYIWLVCLKVLIAGLVVALSDYKAQLAMNTNSKPKVFSYFTYDELAYFETILKTPGRVKALLQNKETLSFKKVSDDFDFEEKAYALIMRYMYGPRSQLNKHLWKYPLYKGLKATTDDEITDKVPKLSQKALENQTERLVAELENLGNPYITYHLVGYILGIPLSITSGITTEFT